jgi:putative endonuclease
MARQVPKEKDLDYLLERYSKPVNPKFYGKIELSGLSETITHKGKLSLGPAYAYAPFIPITIGQWCVYIVECADGTLYTGISNNVSKRLKTHNLGKGAKYTKTRLPVALKWLTECDNRSEASKEEYRIKKLTRKQKLALINEEYR